jgi:hypothetical protein
MGCSKHNSKDELQFYASSSSSNTRIIKKPPGKFRVDITEIGYLDAPDFVGNFRGKFLNV